MALQPRQPSRPDVRIATRLSLPSVGRRHRTGGLRHRAAREPQSRTEAAIAGSSQFLLTSTPDVRVTVGNNSEAFSSWTRHAEPRGTSHSDASTDGSTEGWSCIADPNPRVLLRLRGVGLPPGAGKACDRAYEVSLDSSRRRVKRAANVTSCASGARRRLAPRVAAGTTSRSHLVVPARPGCSRDAAGARNAAASLAAARAWFAFIADVPDDDEQPVVATYCPSVRGPRSLTR